MGEVKKVFELRNKRGKTVGRMSLVTRDGESAIGHAVLSSAAESDKLRVKLLAATLELQGEKQMRSDAANMGIIVSTANGAAAARAMVHFNDRSITREKATEERWIS